MSDFQDQLNSRFINPLKFVTAWEKYLFNGQLLTLTPEKERVAMLQRLRAQSQLLWSHFNSPERSVPKHYMDDPRFLNAYLGAFFLPNVQRLFSILSEQAVQTALSRMAGGLRDEIHIVDFGAGPLSAAIGALFSATHWGLSDAIKVRLTIVERSEKAFEAGKSIIESSFSSNSPLQINRVPSLEKIGERAQLVLAANVINELPAKHQLTTLQKMIEITEEGGLIVVVEPGQDVHSRRLCSLRDATLTNNAKLHVISPCLHAQPCPLSSTSNRPDWCWFRANWNRPKALRDIDFYTRLRHDELAFSFFCLQNGGLPGISNDRLHARVISDAVTLRAAPKQNSSALTWAKNNLAAGDPSQLETLEISEAPIQKSLLCTRAGTLEGAIWQNAETPLERGCVISEEDAPLRCKERLDQRKPDPKI